MSAMTNWLCAIGVLTSLGAGIGFLSSTSWPVVLVCSLTGFGGAGLIVLAILMERGTL